MVTTSNEVANARRRKHYAANRDTINARRRELYVAGYVASADAPNEKIVTRLLKAARQRALNKGITFDLTAGDVRIPASCPVLGIELFPSSGGFAPNSPSLDRIDNSKGYVRGNVAVISQRANRLKSDGTAAEHEAVAAWMRASG